MSLNPQAVTVRSTGLAKTIMTDVEVFIPETESFIQASGIWDTGATATAISSYVVAQLGLIPTGKTVAHTAGGSVLQDTYVIDLVLPNNIRVNGLIATEVPRLSSYCEVLLGMDIITLGDFSITHYKGKSCMSFRIPSLHEIDYADCPKWQLNTEQSKLQNIKLGKKDICFCGSGKKFKECHGRR